MIKQNSLVCYNSEYKRLFSDAKDLNETFIVLEIKNVPDLKPGEYFLENKEYSYNTIVKISNGKRINIGWLNEVNTEIIPDNSLESDLLETSNNRNNKILCYFKISKTSKTEQIYFNKKTTLEEISKYFENKCGGVYRWWIQNVN